MPADRRQSASANRTFTVLKVLVEEHIDTAAPVPSEMIARRSPVRVSSATIRNKMAELEYDGYIVRPHVSSGGVPSPKGYRYYIDALDPQPRVSSSFRHRLLNALERAQDAPDNWAQLASSILSEMSQNAAIVTTPRSSSPRVKHVQLALLEDFLALLVLVLEDARLMKRLIPLERPRHQDDLATVANKLTDAFRGRTVHDIMDETVELTPFESRVARDTVNALRAEDEQAAAEYSVDGLRLLLGQPEFDSPGKAREVLEALEERTLLNYILSQAPERGEIILQIGDEHEEDTLKPFGIVVTRYGSADGFSGVVAIVGPPRMNYTRVIGGVRLFADQTGDLAAATL